MKNYDYEARRDIVIVKVDDYEKKKGELYQAEQWRTQPQTGRVLHIGPDVSGLKVGDWVHFLRFGAIDGLEENERACIDRDIIGVLHER